MQDYAIGLHDNPLRWETERQNRIHQESVEQKKKQLRPEDARRGQQFIEKVTQDVAGSRDYLTAGPRTLQNAQHQSETAPNGMAAPAAEWPDKVRRIPDIRSAWIPLDEATEGSDWSRPFSLLKADMEPWLSFFQGYKESRLFIDSPAIRRNQATDEQPELQLDFAVKAILELKGIGAKVIVEPPVQINSQVEYLDLEQELLAVRDPMRAKALSKVAQDTHQAQLRKAVERGREMGNRLHDALMGEGHVNLIKAWERVHKRKPSVEELHLMLTTGRVNTVERRQPPAIPREAPLQAKPGPVMRGPISPAPQPVIPETIRPAAIPAAPRKPEIVEESEVSQVPGRRSYWKMLLHVFNAAACCAVLVALFLYGGIA